MPTFNQRGYVYVGHVHADWEIDYDEALNEIGAEYVEQWLTNEMGWQPERSDPVTLLLDDPAKRLEVITWLRNNGWKVEPA